MSARQEILARGLRTEDSSSRTDAEVRRQMETAYADCLRCGLPASVLFVEMIRLEPLALQLGIGAADARRAVVELLRLGERVGDLYACEEGAGILALLTNADLEDTELLCRRASEEAKKLTLVGAPRPVRVGLGLGLAHNEGNGALLFETLVLVAREGAAVARQRGGECFVHTMLYEVMQLRAEREALDRGASPPVPALEPADSPPEEPALQAIPEPRVSSPTRRDAPAAPQVQEEVEILRRRIAKLLRTLEAREQTLAELTGLKSALPGIASIYREVQGLSEADPDRERKGKLLQAIFTANLELVRLRRTVPDSTAPETLVRASRARPPTPC